MSSLPALFALWCPSQFEATEEELEAQRRSKEELEVRMKHTIIDPKHFYGLARNEGESGALGVKLLRDKTGVLHVMDTRIWPFHYPFCVSNLGETRTLQEFNEQVYTGKDRSMMFATIVNYRGLGEAVYYCLELNPADPMTDFDALNGFFEDVKKSFCVTSDIKLHFHPTSAAQTEAIKGKQLNLPVMTSSDIYGNIKYKLIQPGVFNSKKICIFEKENYTEDDLNRWLLERTIDDLVIIPSVPNDLPVVGAVFCRTIIPPLCHVALLCQNRKTPCCYLDDIVDRIDRRSMRTCTVSGAIIKAGFFMNGEWNESYPMMDTAAATPKIDVQAPNTSVTNLIDIHEDSQHAKDIHIVGAKAAQMAVIEPIYNQPIFKGTFVIPFHHYDKHVHKNNTVLNAIAGSLKDTKDINNFDKVRELINAQKIDDELVKSVMEKIKQHKMTSVIFRSSTNAEDLTGFNGAGLYESVPLNGKDVTDAQKVGEAIKKVWASVWSSKAVKEREHYRMNHTKVNMAILVQPFIDSKMTGVKVDYNGVCITHDVSRHAVKHGFVVNCFPGSDHRATNYYKDKSPEQTTLLLGREENSIDIQIMTTATGHTQSMITQQDAEKMVSVFGSLHTSMLNKPHKLDDTVALDIEFMVVESDKREIVVLQARPYNVNVLPHSDLEWQLSTYICYRYSDYSSCRMTYFNSTEY